MKINTLLSVFSSMEMDIYAYISHFAQVVLSEIVVPREKVFVDRANQRHVRSETNHLVTKETLWVFL